jgi:hypothetical protein
MPIQGAVPEPTSHIPSRSLFVYKVGLLGKITELIKDAHIKVFAV